MPRFSSLLLALLVTGLGCQVIGGVDDLVVAGGEGAGGSGGSGVGGSTMSGWLSGTEDCLNGKDDDGDGDVDCADTQCVAGGFSCIPLIPVGWQVGAFLDAPFQPGVDAPSCPDGAPAKVVFAEPGAAPTCAACSCSYQGATCSGPEVSCWFSDGGCGGTPNAKIQAPATQCDVLPNVPQGLSEGSCLLSAPPTPVNKGACTTTGGEASIPPMWGKQGYLCGVPSFAGGCDDLSACAPSASIGFANGHLCIVKAGNQECPADWSAFTMSAYENGSDSRACSACACDINTVTCAGGIAWVYDDTACGGSNVPIQGDSGCTIAATQFDTLTASIHSESGYPNPGTCASSTPQGSVAPAQPLTVCCQ